MPTRVFLSLSVLVMLSACSSSSTNPSTSSDAGEDVVSPPQHDSAPPDVDASQPVDAGIDSAPLFVDGSTPEGGTPATPNKVACGNTTCTTPGEVCCAPAMAGGAYACVPAGPNACAGGFKQECDDRQDCATGEVCCVILDQGPSATSTCAGDCLSASAAYQACRVNGECQTGSPCNVLNCGTAGKWELCADNTPAQCH